jgi:hypothetical protein
VNSFYTLKRDEATGGGGKLHDDEIGMAYSTNGEGEECILDIGGKGRRKEMITNTKMYVAGQY